MSDHACSPPVTGRFRGDIRPVAGRAYASVGFLPPRVPYPASMMRQPPPVAQIVADVGPAHLGCVRWGNDPGCRVVVVTPAGPNDWFFVKQVGDGDLLAPRRPMTVLEEATFETTTKGYRVVGGLHGLSAGRVQVELVNSDIVDATVDHGALFPGDTLFWVDTSAPVRRVWLRGAEGDVHTDRASARCDGRCR